MKLSAFRIRILVCGKLLQKKPPHRPCWPDLMQRGNAAPIAAERGNDMSEILDQIWMTSLTTLLSIAVLFLLAKLMGNKQVSQMTMFDYVVGITIGSSAAELATELENPAKPLIAMLLYALIGLIEKWYLCRCKIS